MSADVYQSPGPLVRRCLAFIIQITQLKSIVIVYTPLIIKEYIKERNLNVDLELDHFHGDHMVACICHLTFPATTQYFLKKYCVVATLSQHIIFCWHVSATLFFPPQHNIF